jgi:hypothetical protein
VLRTKSLSVVFARAPASTAAATATATAAASGASATATAPVVALPGWARFCHGYFASVKHLAVQTTNGLRSILLGRHFDEGKSSGPATHPIGDDVHRFHLAHLSEERVQRVLGGIITQISYVQLLGHLGLLFGQNSVLLPLLRFRNPLLPRGFRINIW